MRDKIFGMRLKKLRKARGLSQLNLAKFLNVSQRIVSNWENSEANPQWETYEKLAIFFNVKTEYLLGLDVVSQNIIKEYREKKLVDISNGLDDYETYTFKKLYLDYKKAQEKLENEDYIKDISMHLIDVMEKQKKYDNFVYSKVIDKLLSVNQENYKFVPFKKII